MIGPRLPAPGLLVQLLVGGLAMLLSYSATRQLSPDSSQRASQPVPLPQAIVPRPVPNEPELQAVLRLLRSGDREAAMNMLRKLSRSDPERFWEFVNRIPAFAELESWIVDLAFELPPESSEAVAILNGIHSGRLRSAAWKSYLQGCDAAGLDDASFLQVAESSVGVPILELLDARIEEAARDRPREFFLLLRQPGRGAALERFSNHLLDQDPDLARELIISLSRETRRLTEIDRRFLLQTVRTDDRVAALDEVVATWENTPGGEGWLMSAFGAAARGADVETTEGLVTLALGQAPALRNSALGSLVEPSLNDPTGQLTSRIIREMTTFSAQRQAVDRAIEAGLVREENFEGFAGLLGGGRATDYLESKFRSDP